MPAANFHLAILIGPATFFAMAVCGLAVLLLYRRIDGVGRIGQALWVGVALAMLLAIAAGLSHFSLHRAFDFPPDAFTPNTTFFNGLGLAMLIATYDYWGYYNVCFLGGEVRQPERTIPRAVVISILLTATLYLLLNISVLGAMPWRAIQSSNAQELLASLVSSVWGRGAGIAMALLVIWTAFASVYALLLGYSRVPYAAAVDGNYFRSFARLHPRLHFPHVSLLTLGAVTLLFCTLQLKDLVAALVVLRIVLQFLLQQAGLIRLRITRPDLPRPFRVWLYPLPPLLAMAGFAYILVMRPQFQRELLFAGVVALTGTTVYLLRNLISAATEKRLASTE
jgi:basic amino acid/polyamine antiporter, APA family